MDIEIELLQLNIDGAAGHEHRIGAIAARAAEILAARIKDRQEKGIAYGGVRVPRIEAEPVRLDLAGVSDERAALSIAGAWMDALTAKFRGGG